MEPYTFKESPINPLLDPSKPIEDQRQICSKFYGVLNDWVFRMKGRNEYLVFDGLRNILGVFGKGIYLDFLELKGTFKNSVIINSTDRQIKIPNLVRFDVNTAIFPWHVTSKEVFEKEKLYNPYSSWTTSRPIDRINNLFPYITEVDTKNIKCLGFDNPFVQLLNNPNEAAFDNMEVCCFNEVFKAEWENLKKRIVKHSEKDSSAQLIKKINDFWVILSNIENIEAPHCTFFDTTLGNSPFATTKEISGNMVRGIEMRSHDIFAHIVQHLQADSKLTNFLCEHCELYGMRQLISDSRFREYVEYWHNEPKPGVLLRYSMEKINEMMKNYHDFSDDLYKVFKNMSLSKNLKENLLEAAKEFDRKSAANESKPESKNTPGGWGATGESADNPLLIFRKDKNIAVRGLLGGLLEEISPAQESATEPAAGQFPRNRGRPKKFPATPEKSNTFQFDKIPIDWQVIKGKELKKLWLGLNDKDRTGHTFRKRFRTGNYQTGNIHYIEDNRQILSGQLAVRREWYCRKIEKDGMYPT